MGPLILLDTSELLRPMPRKLHAAWAEVHGRKAAMPPTSPWNKVVGGLTPVEGVRI